MAEQDFEAVRAELRRRGYLQRGVERFLLQDALRPRAAFAALVRLALRVGLLLGILAAVAAAVGLSTLNGGFPSHPADAAVLTLHLLPPAIVVTALLFLALAAPLVFAFRTSRRAGERLALIVAVLASAAWLAFVALRGRGLLVDGPRWLGLAIAVGAVVVGWLLGRVLYDGLLAVAARFSRLEPGGFSVPRWVLGAVAVIGVLALVGPALFATSGGEAPAPFLPTAPGERVLLVGIDGVLAQEFDYLMARGELSAIAARRSAGSAILRYVRPSGPPASLWTSVATGLEPAAHGVVGVDSYRPLGVTVPLVRSGPVRVWWRLENAIGLCEYRPVVAARRLGWSVWELAARGGAPVAAVDWWSTFPAEPSPGLIVAHGAYQLLSDHADGAVEPKDRVGEIDALRHGDAVQALDSMVRSALPANAAESVLERAVRPDLFYLSALRRGLAASPRAAALYLPGLDIAASTWSGSDVALGDLVRAAFLEVDRLVSEASGFGTVVIVADPGRRRGDEGRVLVLRSGCAGSEERIQPEAVASSLLRALGLPQSAELPPPVPGCEWPAPPSTVAGYGPRRAAGGAGSGDQEYLESLRSLGYL